MIYTKILDRIQRAARNGERLHLDVDQVRALVRSPVYATLTELHTQELESSWQQEPAAPPVRKGKSSEPGPSGSDGDPTAMSGASAGTIEELVIDAESELVTAEARKLIHRSKRRKRSRTITPLQPAGRQPPTNQPRSRPRLVSPPS